MSRFLIVFCLMLAPIASLAQSDAHLDKALRLAEVSGSDEILDQMYAAIMPQMMALAGADANLSAEEREVMNRYMERSLALLQEELNWTTLSPHFAQIYANVYTEEEIDVLIDFYSSDVGQKVLEKTPEVAAQTLSVVGMMMERIEPKLMALSEELAEELTRARQ